MTGAIQGPTAASGNVSGQNTALQPASTHKRGSARAVALGVVLVLADLATFLILGTTGVLAWLVCLPAAAFVATVCIGVANMIAGHLRG